MLIEIVVVEIGGTTIAIEFLGTEILTGMTVTEFAAILTGIAVADGAGIAVAEAFGGNIGRSPYSIGDRFCRSLLKGLEC